MLSLWPRVITLLFLKAHFKWASRLETITVYASFTWVGHHSVCFNTKFSAVFTSVELLSPTEASPPQGQLSWTADSTCCGVRDHSSLVRFTETKCLCMIGANLKGVSWFNTNNSITSDFSFNSHIVPSVLDRLHSKISKGKVKRGEFPH